MVAIIKTGDSIHRIFNYNENKVKEGTALCIGAGNYPIDVEKMSLKIKLNRLLKQAELNENVSRKSVHVSLNFDVAEGGMSQEKLMQIADVYMKEIGFEEQPYLVYQHFDAGHPHIHIVSIKVGANGSRIDMQNIGRNQSEKARKGIEKTFGLIAAQYSGKKDLFTLQPISTGKALYGKSQTKMAIQNVLINILDQYNYVSLPQLNAVLKLYNVTSDRGTENSRVFKNSGLLYRIIDENGKPVGIPIKASAFYNKPTLKYVEERYKVNETKRHSLKYRLKNEIDKLFITQTPSFNDVLEGLQQKGINVQLRKNEAGFIYGVTYIDHLTKTVFNGSELGKQYSAKALQERCLKKSVLQQDLLSKPAVKPLIGLQPQHEAAAETNVYQNDLKFPFNSIGTNTILEILTEPEKTLDFIPRQLKKKGRKKKKRKNISAN